MTTLAVGTAARPAAAGAERAIAVWLLVCAGLVFAMAVIGAITRLTESGLSIVEWAPLIGALPPLSEAEWERLFALYRDTPQYHLTFQAMMTLDQFKEIFFWEWLHRLWGRMIGVAFAVPFLWFWVRGRIPRPLLPRLLAILLLGAAQGALGWYMVMSGLIDRPTVSQYRLAAHLGLAVVIYGLLVWVALDLLLPRVEPVRALVPAAAVDRVRRFAWIAVSVTGVTMFWGALVAGLDAGLGFNTWPLMGGLVLPPEAWAASPAWLNLFETPTMVQFVHRWLGVATALTVAALWLAARSAGLSGRAGRLAAGAAAMALVQTGLGIATLLLYVPVWLGALHQAGALVLLTLLLWLAFELRPAAEAQPARGATARQRAMAA